MKVQELFENGDLGLTIFDIDDTLFRTTAQIKVVKDGKIIKSLNNQEFNTYKLQPGESFDFGEFRNAEKFNRESIPIEPMIAKLKAIINNAGDSKVIMLTARSDFDNKELFLDTFRKYGIDMDRVHVHRAGNLGGSPSQNKAVWIRKYLDTGKYARVRLYDDAMSNIKMFINLQKEYPDVKFFPYFVTHEGSIKTIREDGRIVKGVNTTADVGPNEIKTQAAKFGNRVDKDGYPPTMSKAVRGSSTNVLFNLGLAESSEPRYTAKEWAIMEGGHSLEESKPRGPGDIFNALNEYEIEETRSFQPQTTPLQALVLEYLTFTSTGIMTIVSDGAKSPQAAEELKKVFQTLNQSNKKLQAVANDKQKLEANKTAILKNIYDMMTYAIAHLKANMIPQEFDSKKKQINSVLTKYNDLTKNESVKEAVEPNFEFEWEEATRYPEFVKIGKEAWIELASKGKTVTIKSAKGINNTDAADPDSFKSLDKDKQTRALAQLKSGDVEMPIVAVYPDGWKELIGGNTRLTAMLAQDGQATVWVFRVPDEVAELAENFADGKKPGRKGLAKRSGVNTKASVSSLRKTAKNSSGEKQRMAHWLANMKAGRKKAAKK